MRVVLGEAADAEQPVQRAAQLVAVHQAQLAHAQRQVAVGVRLVFIYQHPAGAVHGLDGVVLLVDDRGVHVGLVMVPVAAALPELAVEDDGRGDLHIAVALVYLAPVVDEGVLQRHAVGQEEGEARAGLVHHEEPQLAAQLAVVAPLRLFQTIEIGLKFLFFHKTCAVNALEHFAAGVAAPVRAGAVHQLDGVALYAPGVVKVRAGAEVGELSLLIEADGLALRQVLDELHLIGLVPVRHELDGLFARQLEALDGQLLLADAAHLLFQLLQHLGGEGHVAVYIVVKAVLNSGAYGQLALRVQALDGLGQDVAGGVAVGVAVFLILKGVFVFFHVFYLPLNEKHPRAAARRRGALGDARFHPEFGSVAG